MSAIVPSGGQIYNNKYRSKNKKSKLWWKLPIIYGALGACTYSAIQYNAFFKEILTERKYRLNNDYIPQLLPTLSSQQLYSVQENYRKYRDYSIIGGILIYVLNIIDANVEGHLLHFDTGDKLSLYITPNYYSLNNSLQTKLIFVF